MLYFFNMEFKIELYFWQNICLKTVVIILMLMQIYFILVFWLLGDFFWTIN